MSTIGFSDEDFSQIASSLLFHLESKMQDTNADYIKLWNSIRASNTKEYNQNYKESTFDSDKDIWVNNTDPRFRLSKIETYAQLRSVRYNSCEFLDEVNLKKLNYFIEKIGDNILFELIHKKINPINIINNFGDYLENQINLKEKIVKDLENKSKSQNISDHPETIEFYRGQLIEVKNIKRCFELAKLGEVIKK